MRTIIVPFLFLLQIGVSQNKDVSGVLQEIDFTQDTVKSVFDWVADNVKYDIKKFNKIGDIRSERQNEKFNSKEEYQNHLLKKVISQKKGVCEDYSLLFHSIMTALGYDSAIITGYIKDSKGRVQNRYGHAWNTVKVNGEWKLYEPTWAAGYVIDGKKFVQKYTSKWYDVEPSEMIKSHMPYDPMWQLSKKPTSYKSFDESLYESNLNENAGFNYVELIEQHLVKGEKEQIMAHLERSQQIGEGIRLVKEWRRRMYSQIELNDLEEQLKLYNAMNQKMTSAVEHYNAYIVARNKRFKGRKWNHDAAEKHLLSAKDLILEVGSAFENMEIEQSRAKDMIDHMLWESDKLLRHVEQELRFLENVE